MRHHNVNWIYWYLNKRHFLVANITSNNDIKIKAEQLYSFYFFEDINDKAYIIIDWYVVKGLYRLNLTPKGIGNGNVVETEIQYYNIDIFDKLFDYEEAKLSIENYDNKAVIE